MHVHFLDPHRAGDSVIHRLDSRVKLALTLMFIVTVSLTPFGAWAAYILLLAIVLSVELLSELGIGYVVKRSVLATPFLLAALPLIFTVPGEVLVTVPFLSWNLTITAPGVERFLSIAVKSWISVQMAIVLAATTSFPELLWALRALHVPKLLVAVLGLMWRYIFVLADEALRLLRARNARSGASPQLGRKTGGSIAWRARVTGGMTGNLFVRGFDRGDRIYAAMRARGYDGEARAFAAPPLQIGHWMMLGGGLLVCLLILFIANLVAR